MRLALALLAVACACGSSSSTSPDGGGGGGDDDGSLDPTGDGGTGGHAVKLTLVNRPLDGAPFSFFVAYQDGSAPWQAAPAPAGDTYTLSIHAPTYSVAYGCIAPASNTTDTELRTVTMAQFALGERTELSFDVPARCSDRGEAPVTLSGTVTSRPWGGFLFVQFGDRSAFVGGQSGGFALQTPPGTHDLFVAHGLPEGNGEYVVDRVAVVRDLAVTGTTSRTIDFDTAEPTQTFGVDVDLGFSSARVVATTMLYTENGTALGTVRESQGWQSEVLAATQMRASDVYDQAVAINTPGRSVTLTSANGDPGAQTVVPPPALGAVDSSVPAKAPYPIIETTWPAYPDSIGYAWNATQQLAPQDCGGNRACVVAWTAYVSPGVTGEQPAYRMPVLAGLPGWDAGFELAASEQVVGSVTAQTSSAGAGDFPPGVPASGTERAFVRTDFAVTP